MKSGAHGGKTRHRGIHRVQASKSEILAYYDRIAGIYGTLAERPERELRERGVAALAPKPGERILEIGIGTGVSLVAFAKAVGARGLIVGLDLSERMIEQARHRVGQRGQAGRVQLIRGDGAMLPLRSGVVDGVFMSFTLELFDTPEIPVVLGECRRVLGAGGRITVVALSNQQPMDCGASALEWLHEHFPGLLNCRPIPVRQALEEAGFGIRQARMEHQWVPVEVVLAVNPEGES